MINIDEYMKKCNEAIDYQYTTNFIWDLMTSDTEQFFDFINDMFRDGDDTYLLEKASDVFKIINIFASNCMRERQQNVEFARQLLALRDEDERLAETLQTLDGLTEYDFRYAITMLLTNYFMKDEELKKNHYYVENRKRLYELLTAKWMKNDVNYLESLDYYDLDEGQPTVEDIVDTYIYERINGKEEA